MHRGTVCMHGSGLLLSPYSGVYTVCPSLFPLISHCKTSHKYDKSQCGGKKMHSKNALFFRPDLHLATSTLM